MNNLTWPTPYAVHYVSWPTLFNVSKNSDPSPIFHSPPPPPPTCTLWPVPNCLFPLNIVQNEIQLLSRVSSYSWLVCLSRFWLRNTSLVKAGNPISDGIVFVFHLAGCVIGLKSLKRFWPYLIVFSASRVVSLSNYFTSCLFFISNSMKSSVVMGLFSLCTFVRLETMIWPFDWRTLKSLQTFSHRK